jgi:hypothetical protein
VLTNCGLPGLGSVRLVVPFSVGTGDAVQSNMNYLGVGFRHKAASMHCSTINTRIVDLSGCGFENVRFSLLIYVNAN